MEIKGTINTSAITVGTVDPKIVNTHLEIHSGPIYYQKYQPKKVIFNKPATIVYWTDGTKTVVKCKKGDRFDKWTGFAMAYLKKVYGTEFHAFLKKWCND